MENYINEFTEKSLAYLFAHYNHFDANWTNTQEETRAQVPPLLRRYNLWLSYTNGENKKITERFIGTNEDALNPDNWKNSQYWENLDFELLVQGASQAVNNAINNLNLFPKLKETIINAIRCYLRDAINMDYVENLLMENIGQYLDNMGDVLNQLFIEFLASKDGLGDLIRAAVEDLIGEIMEDYFNDIKQTLLDEERVVANALARHEQAILELQNANNTNS